MAIDGATVTVLNASGTTVGVPGHNSHPSGDVFAELLRQVGGLLRRGGPARADDSTDGPESQARAAISAGSFERAIEILSPRVSREDAPAEALDSSVMRSRGRVVWKTRKPPYCDPVERDLRLRMLTSGTSCSCLEMQWRQIAIPEVARDRSRATRRLVQPRLVARTEGREYRGSRLSRRSAFVQGRPPSAQHLRVARLKGTRAMDGLFAIAIAR